MARHQDEVRVVRRDPQVRDGESIERVVGRRRLRDPVVDRGGGADARAVVRVGEEVGLGPVVEVDRRSGDPDCLTDLVDADVVVATLAEEAERGCQDLVPPGRGDGPVRGPSNARLGLDRRRVSTETIDPTSRRSRAGRPTPCFLDAMTLNAVSTAR